MRRSRVLALAAVAVLAMVAVACSDDDDNGDAATEGEGNGGDRTVTVFGAFVDEDADRFAASMEAFEERTGITVRYEGSGDFENLLPIRAQGGDLADIVLFPQPGTMADLAQSGDLEPLEGAALDAFENNYNESWQDLASVDGDPYGIWYRASLKSLVWYPAGAFDEAGYEEPGTWDEMIELSDQIVADGGTPWCIGIESAGATGWVATDWVEDIMLRLHGPDVYDQWVDNELPFDSPEVTEAVEKMSEIWFADDYVRGGVDGILSIPFGDAADPMFDDDPLCWMHRQATFITAFFPEEVQESLATDEPQVRAFYLPAIDESVGSPALTAGDVAAISSGNARPEVIEVMAYLGTGESGLEWARAGGYLSPHEDFDASVLPTEVEQLAAEILAEADFVRFDASDLMPADVGSGAFWTEMVNYVNGADLSSSLSNIDDAWPN